MPVNKKFPNNSPTRGGRGPTGGGKGSTSQQVNQTIKIIGGPTQEELEMNLGSTGFGIPQHLGGEIIELQKIHYGQSSVSELLDRSFNEITKTRDNITPENFFNLYNQLFYDIPKDGKNSHTFLIEESTDYIGGYEDPKGEKINSLIDRVIELETTALQNPTDHPLFGNGTAIRAGGSLGIMQEGKLRRVSNSGDPSPYQQLKKTLGLKGADGKPLSDEDSWTVVSTQTWESLPRWPEGTEINEVADWSLTLSQFNVAASNITLITDTIAQSELDSSEISFLIDELGKKTPFKGHTIEDNFNGTIEYTEEDLEPIGVKGTWEGQEAVFYIGYHERLVPMSHLDINSAISSIIGYWEARDSKGLYDLGDWYESLGHMTPEEQEERQLANSIAFAQKIKKAIPDWLGLDDDVDRIFVQAGSNIGKALDAIQDGIEDAAGSYLAKQVRKLLDKINFTKYPEHPDKHIYGEDWKSQMLEDLEELGSHVENNNFHRYIWGTDWEKSFNQQTLDGVPIFNGQMYWIKDDTTRYKNWARDEVKNAITIQKSIYGQHNKLVEIERLIRS